MPVDDIGMVETAPFDAIRDAQTFENRRQRTAGEDAREIMRAGVEAVETGAPFMMRLAQEAVAESARHDMRIVHFNLQAGLCEQGRRDEPADSGADDRDIHAVARRR